MIFWGEEKKLFNFWIEPLTQFEFCNNFFSNEHLKLITVSSTTVEFCSQTSDWTFWLVNFWLPKIWEEHFWKVIKLSISFFTLFYTLIREDWRSCPLEVLSVMSRLVMQVYTSFCDPSQIHLLNRIIILGPPYTRKRQLEA